MKRNLNSAPIYQTIPNAVVCIEFESRVIIESLDRSMEKRQSNMATLDVKHEDAVLVTRRA